MRHTLRSLLARLLVAAALLAFVPGFAADALAQAGLRVSEVEFKGNRTLDSEVLRQSIRTRRGSCSTSRCSTKTSRRSTASSGACGSRRRRRATSPHHVRRDGERARRGGRAPRRVGAVREGRRRRHGHVEGTPGGRLPSRERREEDRAALPHEGLPLRQVTTSTADAPGGKTVTFDVLEGRRSGSARSRSRATTTWRARSCSIRT